MEEDGGPEMAGSRCESYVSCGKAHALQQGEDAVFKAAEQNFSTEIFRVSKLIERRQRAVYVFEDLNARL